MRPKTVLITGVAGFIGSHLAERCLELGWQVIGIDAFTEYYEPGLKRANVSTASDNSSFTSIEGELLDLELEPILREVAVVFHLAAQPGVRASWDEFDIYTRMNITSTQRLLDAARRAPLDRFVLASSSSIYGDAETFPTAEDARPRPVSPYGVTKLAAEHLGHLYWRNHDVPTVALRYFTVFGPRQRPDMAFHRMICCALAGRRFEVFGDGEQTRDFTYVDDAVSGTVAAALYGVPGCAYNIGGGSRRSMNRVFATLEQLCDIPLQRVYRASQPGDARDTGADIGRAQLELGFDPSADFAWALQAQLQWQRALLASAEVGS